MNLPTAYSASGRITFTRFASYIHNVKETAAASLRADIESIRNKADDIITVLRNDNNTELFINARPGDIVTIVKPWNRTEFTKIKASTRMASYVIVTKTDTGIIGYPYRRNTEKVSVRNNDSTLYMTADNEQILLRNADQFEGRRIHAHSGHLSAADQLRINMFLNENENPEDMPRFHLALPIRTNSVVRRGNDWYYIYSMSENTADVYKLITNRTSLPVNFNGTLRYINCSAKETIELDGTYTAAGTLTNSVHNTIAQRLKNAKRSAKPKSR